VSGRSSEHLVSLRGTVGTCSRENEWPELGTGVSGGWDFARHIDPYFAILIFLDAVTERFCASRAEAKRV
jgi:hypothetical protein